ncbi:Leucine-rich repeat-containing protein 74A, partial [Gryllus bimaculatus]
RRLAEEVFGTALAGKPTDFRDDGGERHYRYMCKQLDVVPSQQFIRQLRTSTASFRYYGLDPRGVRPMTEALSKNKYVKRLDLEENWLTFDSACHLTELFLENDTIEYLNLTGC